MPKNLPYYWILDAFVSHRQLATGNPFDLRCVSMCE